MHVKELFNGVKVSLKSEDELLRMGYSFERKEHSGIEYKVAKKFEDAYMTEIIPENSLILKPKFMVTFITHSKLMSKNSFANYKVANTFFARGHLVIDSLAALSVAVAERMLNFTYTYPMEMFDKIEISKDKYMQILTENVDKNTLEKFKTFKRFKLKKCPEHDRYFEVIDFQNYDTVFTNLKIVDNGENVLPLDGFDVFAIDKVEWLD